MRTYKSIDFMGRPCKLELTRYSTGGMAIMINSDAGEPMACCTVNIPDLAVDEIAVKNWSENEGMEDTLLEHGVITPRPERHVASGFVKIPVYKVTHSFMKEQLG